MVGVLSDDVPFTTKAKGLCAAARRPFAVWLPAGDALSDNAVVGTFLGSGATTGHRPTRIRPMQKLTNVVVNEQKFASITRMLSVR